MSVCLSICLSVSNKWSGTRLMTYMCDLRTWPMSTWSCTNVVQCSLPETRLLVRRSNELCRTHTCTLRSESSPDPLSERTVMHRIERGARACQSSALESSTWHCTEQQLKWAEWKKLLIIPWCSSVLRLPEQHHCGSSWNTNNLRNVVRCVWVVCMCVVPVVSIM